MFNGDYKESKQEEINLKKVMEGLANPKAFEVILEKKEDVKRICAIFPRISCLPFTLPASRLKFCQIVSYK
jgi:hypothetical protein